MAARSGVRLSSARVSAAVLQFAAGVVLVAGIFSAVVGVVIAPAYSLGGDEARVAVVATGDRLPSVESAEVSSDSWSGDLSIKGVDHDHVFLSVLPIAFLSLATLAGCIAVFGLLRDIGSGRPFTNKNVTRLVALAGIVLGGWLGSNALEHAASDHVLAGTGLSGTGLEPPPIFSLAPFAVACLILAVAVAFARGRQIQDDVAGLV
ncbi:MAG TPA: hypothetical protein VFX15_03940 [Actinomycetes bacterium]|nr:hypothetical protein [Actinomycetes bacterium]